LWLPDSVVDFGERKKHILLMLQIERRFLSSPARRLVTAVTELP